MRVVTRSGLLALGFVVGALFMIHCGDGGGRKAVAGRCAVDVCYDPATSGLLGVDVQAALDELAALVTALDSRLTVAEGSITSLESRATALEAADVVFGSRLTTAEGSITSIDTRVTSLEGSVAGLTTQLNALDTKVTGLVLHNHQWINPPTNLLTGQPANGPYSFNLTGLVPAGTTSVVIRYQASASRTFDFTSGALSVQVGSPSGGGGGLLLLPVSSPTPMVDLTLSGTLLPNTDIDLVGYIENWSP